METERGDDVTTADMPLIVVFAGDDRPAPDFGGESGRSFTVRVEIYVEGATGAAAQEALSEIFGRVREAVAADVTLGGLAHDIRESDDEVPDRLTVQNTDPARSTTVVLAVEYSHAEGDPFQLP